MENNRGLERFLDINEICSAVIEQDENLATKLLQKKTFFFVNLPCGNVEKCPNVEVMNIFLNSLNLGIYTRALNLFGCNLQTCCVDNSLIIGNIGAININDFVYAGSKIINVYTTSINDYIKENSRCQHRIYITKAKQYIEKNIKDSITLEDVAREIFISPSYLSTLFNSFTGTTFVSYITSFRIDKAKNLLLSTTLNINDIAIQCGFSQSSYFITTFKKIVGITPHQFRKEITAAIS
ncbi:MAG: AraC family transcriptional regulator [Defluviitaleaceae bacterium]|nr:AraC family transcriptional regulator [Defluviitaleaceae bacterium]